MTGIRFHSWEHFLYYVQNREGIAPGAGWSNVSILSDADYLEADEWEGLQKMLSAADYEELTGKKHTIEVRSFRMSEESGRMIFYAVGEEDRDGGYLCGGYGIVNESDIEDKNNRFRPMPEESDREKDILERNRTTGKLIRFCKRICRKRYWNTLLHRLPYWTAIMERTEMCRAAWAASALLSRNWMKPQRKPADRYWRSIISRNLCMNILIRSRSAAQSG